MQHLIFKFSREKYVFPLRKTLQGVHAKLSKLFAGTPVYLGITKGASAISAYIYMPSVETT